MIDGGESDEMIEEQTEETAKLSIDQSNDVTMADSETITTTKQRQQQTTTTSTTTDAVAAGDFSH
jgi:hypothetical protein